MNTKNAEGVLNRVMAYWPSPNMSDQEAVGWVELLTDPAMDLSYTEVATVLRKISYAGEPHRPRPGQIVVAVKAERRAQAQRAETSRMLTEGRTGAVSPERTGQWVRTCRRVLAGEPLDDAKRAEGILEGIA